MTFVDFTVYTSGSYTSAYMYVEFSNGKSIGHHVEKDDVCHELALLQDLLGKTAEKRTYSSGAVEYEIYGHIG